MYISNLINQLLGDLFFSSYNQYFDLEGESGIVVRGIGTAVTLVRHLTLPSVNLNLQPTIDE